MKLVCAELELLAYSCVLTDNYYHYQLMLVPFGGFCVLQNITRDQTEDGSCCKAKKCEEHTFKTCNGYPEMLILVDETG